MTSSPQGEGSGGVGKEEGSGEERKEGNDQPHISFPACWHPACSLLCRDPKVFLNCSRKDLG